jgi:hypothetical protein
MSQGWRPGVPGSARIAMDERASLLSPGADRGFANVKRLLRSTDRIAFVGDVQSIGEMTSASFDVSRCNLLKPKQKSYGITSECSKIKTPERKHRSGATNHVKLLISYIRPGVKIKMKKEKISLIYANGPAITHHGSSRGNADQMSGC